MSTTVVVGEGPSDVGFTRVFVPLKGLGESPGLRPKTSKVPRNVPGTRCELFSIVGI